MPGEHLLLADGRAPPITAISHHDEITTVCNLSIAHVHTFFVGSHRVLVHNDYFAEEAAAGGLSRAGEFALKGYQKLRRTLQDTELQAHHLLEKRFARILGQSPSAMLSMALTKAHQVFTNAWRKAIPYGEGILKTTRG